MRARTSKHARVKRPRATPKARALAALRDMREGRSLTAAAARQGTTPRTIKRHAGQAIRRDETRLVVSKHDRVPRTLRFPTERGNVALKVSGSRAASQVSGYWHAVDVYLREGDRRLLQPFERLVIRVRGKRHRFITDPRILDRLAHAGQVQFEDIYETTA